MTLRTRMAGFAVLALPLTVPLATAQQAGAGNPPDVAALLQRLEEQEQRIRILERKLETQGEAAKSAVSSTPVVRATPTRLSITSANGANNVRFRGVLHFDGRRFGDDVTAATADTFLLRRVRPTIEGTFNNLYDFRFTPDFAGGRSIVLDGYVAARFKPWATVQAGKFKVPVGLERLQSASDIRFIERAFPTSLVPNRDLGISFGGDVGGGVFNYSIGYYNGVNDGGSSDGNTPPDAENDTAGDVAARVFFQPFVHSDNFALRGLGFGIAGTYIDTTGSASNTLLGSYRTPGQQTFFSYRGNTAATATTPALSNATFADGERIRVSPQFYYYRGRVGLLGEYVRVSQDVTRVNGAVTRSDTLDNEAWHLQFSWFLTGEEESFRGFTPGSTFQIGKPGRGAWELVARVHELDIDDDAFVGGANSFANPATAASKASAFGLGVNWYLNQNVKWSLNYERTEFEGGAATGDRDDEEALLTRIGFSF